MPVPRVYLPEAREPGTAIPLPAETARHLRKALRLEPGAAVTAFDGDGGELDGVLVEGDSGPALRLEKRRDTDQESPLETSLWAGLAKGEKMDWVVQKATELGVTAIRPVQTARSVRRLTGAKAAKNQQRWERIAISACEQCGRSRLPRIEPVADLAETLEPGGIPGLVLTGEGAPPPARPPGPPLSLLVGPEGGLTPEEIAAAEAAGFHATRLGPRTLRTETAAIAGLTWAQTLWGDFPGP